MTTTISLAARDFIVVGCDSLATTSSDWVHPAILHNEFFEGNGSLKVGADGSPVLKDASQIWAKAQSLPVNQLPNVTKLYDLEPFRACLLFAGISRIGETTVKNLSETFKTGPVLRNRKSNYTMAWLAEKLRDHILALYQSEIPNDWQRPMMEVILSGYSAKHREPEVWRLLFSYNRVNGSFGCDLTNPVARKQFNVIFGGQYDVIQRIVHGLDVASFFSLRQRFMGVLDTCWQNAVDQVAALAPGIVLTKPDFATAPEFDAFGSDTGGVTKIYSDAGSLSEQAGIDFVYFLVSVMIKAQEFSNTIPTVGGNIHIAILSKGEKFRWVSKETFRFENEHIARF